MDETQLPINVNLAKSFAAISKASVPLSDSITELNKSAVAALEKMVPIFESYEASAQRMLPVMEAFNSALTRYNLITTEHLSNTLILFSEAFKRSSSIYLSNLSAVAEIDFNEVFKPLTKFDFRIGVVSQAISNQLDAYSTEEHSSDFHESNYQFDPELTIQPEKTDNHADDINYLKFAVIDLSEKISNLKENSTNENLNDNQTDEKVEKPAYKKLKCLIVAFFFVCEFVEHSETAYQLLLWFQQVINHR